MSALKRAISIAGVGGIARTSGVKLPAVSQWDVTPANRVIKVSEATGWQVTPHELRPDLYPNPTDALPSEISEKLMQGEWPPHQKAA